MFISVVENLSNEELLWEEIMKIKAMPVNMAQKKEMKAKLEVCIIYIGDRIVAFDRYSYF